MLIILITRLLVFLIIQPEVGFSEVQILGLESLFNESAGPVYQLLSSGLSFILSNSYLNALFASIFILWNATLLNAILIRNSAFEENTYIPAALYIVLLGFDLDNYFVSSELIGTTGLLISIAFLQQHLRFRNSDEKVLSLGCTLAIASLIHAPFAWYLILILLLFLFYSGTVGRRYLLLLWGFLMILIIAWLPFVFSEQGGEFWKGYAEGFLRFRFEKDWLTNLVIGLSIPILISLKSSVGNLAGMGMTNIQITVKRVFTWIGFFGILTLAFQSNQSASSANVLILALSYFTTEHLLGVRRKWLAELTFSGLLILMLAVLYLSPLY
ncbi:MAG: hypothetical protein HWE21_17875 [Cytophagia bacterium]|nr:hypothetical protein [Cytophagia bacterium]